MYGRMQESGLTEIISLMCTSVIWASILCSHILSFLRAHVGSGCSLIATVCCAKSLQLCLTLCDPMDHNLPVSSVHGILQAWILEWVAIPSSRGSSGSKVRVHVSYVSCIGSRFFTSGTLPLVPPGKPLMAARWKVFFISFLSSLRAHWLILGSGCYHWWLWHLLFTDMAGNILFLNIYTYICL